MKTNEKLAKLIEKAGLEGCTCENDRLSEGQPVHTCIEEFLSTYWIESLEKYKGVKFIDYGYANMADQGTHVLEFKYDHELLSKQDFKDLHEICTRDDDSQPEARYVYFFGSLVIFIHYWA
jgi:hypothetical protein